MKILKFRQFNESILNEEDLPQLPDLGNMGGAPPEAGAAPADGAPGAPKKYAFVFITADKDWASEYPTGGGIKRYKKYEVTDQDLSEWIKSKKLDKNAEEIKAALTGESEMPKDMFFQFKQALRDKSLKYKDKGETDVEYDDDGVPYTDDIEVTFLRHKSPKEEKEDKEKAPVEKPEEKKPEPMGEAPKTEETPQPNA